MLFETVGYLPVSHAGLATNIKPSLSIPGLGLVSKLPVVLYRFGGPGWKGKALDELPLIRYLLISAGIPTLF